MYTIYTSSSTICLSEQNMCMLEKRSDSITGRYPIVNDKSSSWGHSKTAQCLSCMLVIQCSSWSTSWFHQGPADGQFRVELDKSFLLKKEKKFELKQNYSYCWRRFISYVRINTRLVFKLCFLFSPYISSHRPPPIVVEPKKPTKPSQVHIPIVAGLASHRLWSHCRRRRVAIVKPSFVLLMKQTCFTFHVFAI